MPTYTNDDLTDPDEVTSELEALRSEMAKDLFPPAVIPVPSRPGWALRVRTNLANRELESWQKRAGKDAVLQMLLTIVNATEAILKDGKVIESDGERQTFTTEPFMALFRRGEEQLSAADVCRTFLGRDADVNAVASAVLKASGFGNSVDPVDDEVDPTMRSAQG